MKIVSFDHLWWMGHSINYVLALNLIKGCQLNWVYDLNILTRSSVEDILISGLKLTPVLSSSSIIWLLMLYSFRFACFNGTGHWNFEFCSDFHSLISIMYRYQCVFVGLVKIADMNHPVQTHTKVFNWER